MSPERTISRRTFLAGTGMVLSAALLGCDTSLGKSQSTQSEEVIRLGYNGIKAPKVSHIIAQQRGFYQEEGLKIEEYSQSDQIAQGLVTGDIDVLLSSPLRMLALSSKETESPIKLIGALTNYSSYVFVSRESDLHKVEKVAVGPIGGESYYIGVVLLRQLGFSKFGRSDLTFVNSSDSKTRFALVDKGQVDLGLAAKPWWQAYLKERNGQGKPPEVVLDTSRTRDRKIQEVILARSGYLRDHQEALIRFSTAHLKATQWSHQNPEQAIELFTQYTKYPAELAGDFVGEYLKESAGLIFTPSVENMRQSLVDLSPVLEGEIDPARGAERFLSLEIVKKLQQEGVLARYGAK